MRFNSFLNRVIAGSFYLLFFLVPLVFAGNTSELFELNKIWLTYGLAIVIMLAWISKMIVGKRFFFQRTPLDIPIALFLLSQIISTIFSLDSYVSLWGYYSRFNGGLMSTITYILLYYAFVSNLGKKQVMRSLMVSLFSGLAVALWGLPAHFGYDPTCFVFRGNFDVSCWTDAFQPKVRIFSTLGQPDWMAAYMAVLTPIAVAFGIKENQESRIKHQERTKHIAFAIFYLLLGVLFYVDLLFTRSRSGFLAIACALVVFFCFYFFQNYIVHRSEKLQSKSFFSKYWYVLVVLVCIGSITFFVGTSVSQLDHFTFSGLQSLFAHHPASAPAVVSKPTSAVSTGELGGTDSGKIRLFVWQGAMQAWLHHPLFGTGVETFAFAYYQFRPAGHNMTSEWDYLYNKAHNEFLNYLATTGIFGLGTYCAIIVLFFIVAYKKLPRYRPHLYKTEESMAAARHLISWYQLLIVGLVAGFVSILITNFFGFSVVIINIYLFFIPLFVFSIENILKKETMFVRPQSASAVLAQNDQQKNSPWQLFSLAVCILIALFFLITLARYWIADTSYAYGYNLDHAGYYQQAHNFLQQAADAKPQEPVFLDELSINDAVLATALADKDATTAGQLAQEAIQLSDTVTTQHPNDVVYWKTRVRIFYSIGQFNPQLMPYALQAIQKASKLAPTDAKISYNLGLLYSQNNDLKNGIAVMQRTIALKPDYRDAYYALGLFYRQKAIDKDGNVVDTQAEQQAVATMHFILTNFGKDQPASDALKNWGEQ